MSDLYKNHAVLLLDKVRMSAYQRAISKVVRPGMVVADIGCGLGALAYMALDCGVSRVYAIEADGPTLLIARTIAEHADFEKRIKFIKELSYRLKLPQKVDIVISETLGNLGVNENIVAALRDAKRFLKRGGWIIPQGLKVWIAPIENKRWISDVKALGRFLPDDPRMPLGISSEEIRPDEFLAEPRLVFDETLDARLQSGRASAEGGSASGGKACRYNGLNGKVSFTITRNGVVSGFGGWFEATLINGVGFSTSPGAPPTHWKQAFLPLRRPEGVRNGDIIEFDIVVESRGAESVTEYEYRIINPNTKIQTSK